MPQLDVSLKLSLSVPCKGDETELAAQLVQYGPLSVLLLADGLQFYHSGVWTGGLLGCKPDPAAGILSLNHAVLMVGFGKDFLKTYIKTSDENSQNG